MLRALKRSLGRKVKTFKVTPTNLAGFWASGFERCMVPDRIVAALLYVWKRGPTKFAKVIQANAHN
jgi:hypothetical protein